MTEQEIFAAAIKLEGSARAAFLKVACGEHEHQRQEVEALLAAHDDSVGVVPKQGIDLLGATQPRGGDPCPGVVIVGRYKLLERIGEGGMGEVWVADQLEPIRRRVALKLIKPGMDSRSVLARFEAERQALALMDHPNIAKVLDAGTNEDGTPYFVMELVKGTPITEFCDARKLSPRERLELFVPVCQAIQHAHTKGIIHRDIKPSNVLVALHDEQPVPKVIDFGVAKAVGQQLTEKTIFTGFGGLVGTPTYMAPEQATFNQLDIDTRADVYALGVLLYELLAGSPPVERERVTKAALDEVLRLVREEEPPRPSQRLSTSQSRASIAAVRQTDPAKLSKLIQGELDWIVMRALEKDRNRRYETANGFAADVQRYLSGETVQAVPPSAVYRLQKFARKNRALLTTVGAFVGLLFVAAVVSSWLAVRAMHAEVEAKDHAEEADYYTKLFRDTAEEQMIAKYEAMISAVSLQVDLDLGEVESNRRAALLQLIRHADEVTMQIPQTVKWEMSRGQTFDFVMPTKLFDRHRELQEFVTAAALAAGQEFAPLLPPITHDGMPVDQGNRKTSPNQQTLLTWGADGTVRLWDVWTARQKAILRHDKENIVHHGYNSDGLTAFTLDDTGVIRFWDSASGNLRSQIQLPSDLYAKADNEALEKLVRETQLDVWHPKSIDRNACVVLGKDRIITRHVVVKQRPDTGNEKVLDQFFSGPVELWDVTTGQLAGRLEVPDSMIEHLQFMGAGRWISTLDNNPSTAMIYSPDDGRLLTRLMHAEDSVVAGIYTSPSNQRVFTLNRNANQANLQLTAWEPNTWQKIATVTSNEHYPSEFLNDELWYFSDTTDIDGYVWNIYHWNAPVTAVARFGAFRLIRPVDHLLLHDRGTVIDTNTGLRLTPPQGHRFHPSLAKFAEDGRFVVGCGIYSNTIIDTLTEKQFDVAMQVNPLFHTGKGYAWVESPTHQPDTFFRRFPDATQLNIPPGHLELWAQVAVRGELAPNGEFVTWNEHTWEEKRQELAAISPPYADFPFPGYVATDKLHWLRAEYFAATSDMEKQRLAKELLRRAEANGDNPEAARWRTILTPAVDQEANSVSK